MEVWIYFSIMYVQDLAVKRRSPGKRKRTVLEKKRRKKKAKTVKVKS